MVHRNPINRAVAVLAVLVGLAMALVTNAAAVVDEVHYTYTGSTSVAFDWRGDASDIRYGPTSTYETTVTAQPASPTPISSAGPFYEAHLTGLAPGTTYHYSIGGGPDHTFTTAPTGDFRFTAVGDIGATTQYPKVGAIQGGMASQNPAFVVMLGDLTYANQFTQASVDQHFNDVGAWSYAAAYMPVWGNHEWETPSLDDLRNYKGRFRLPNAHGSQGAPSQGCCGEDWSWFDAGGVRFISYPEPYTQATWIDWQTNVGPIMAAAQADPTIHYIVTYGHQPAYSTGFHVGEQQLATILDGFGDTYSKYVLNLNGHSHDYERFQPIHGVTHITAGGGGSTLEAPWTATDPRTAFRAMHLSYLRVDVSSTGMRIDAICGPSTTLDDMVCLEGSVIDSYSIGTPPPSPPPSSTTLYVAQQNPSCSNTGPGTSSQPLCTMSAAASRATAGTTVLVSSGTYNENVKPNSGAPNNPVVFAAAPGASVTVTGQANGFSMSGKSWITIQGFNVTGTTSDGIYVSKSANIKVIGNHVSLSGQPVSGQTGKGIKLRETTDSVIEHNTVDHNTDFGIYLDTCDRIEITNNVVSFNARVYQRAASGIRLYGSRDNTIAYNVSHHNEDSGIESFTGSTNNLVVDNVTYDNGDHGIDNYQSSGNRAIANTVYSNDTAGINFEASSTGSTIANNLSVENGVGSNRTRGNIRVDSSSTSGTTADYDIVKVPTGSVLVEWGGVAYLSLPAFVTARGQEVHGLEADPLWVAPASGNFHLLAGSPAIDSANSGVAGQPSADIEGRPRSDDPLTPNTGVGPRPFDDRGAYEFQFDPEVGAAPVAALTVSPATVVVNAQVSADSSGSFDMDGSIASYAFDFGDGSPVVGPQPESTATHTYTAVGTYTVTVTVTDNEGLTSTASAQVTVTDGSPPPPPNLIGNPGFETSTSGWNTSGSASGVVLSRVSGGHSGDWAAQLANNGAASGSCVLNDSPDWVKPTQSGTYTASTWVRADTPGATVRLRLREYAGSTLVGTQIAQQSLTTGWQQLTASYTITQPGSSLDLNAYVTGAVPGTCFYVDDVSLTLGSAPHNTPPVAALTVSPSSVLVGVSVTADASASSDPGGSVASYAFDFGDGSPVVGPQPGATATHAYAAAGSYTVTVTVTDSGGLTATASQGVTVTTSPPPPPNLIGNPGFESSTSGWNTSGSGSGVVLSRVSGGHSGDWAALLANNGTSSASCVLNDSPDWVKPSQAGTYTGSVWVRADVAGQTVKLRMREYVSNTLVGTQTSQQQLTTGWQQITVSYTITQPGSSLDFNVYVSGAPPGNCFYADDATITRS